MSNGFLMEAVVTVLKACDETRRATSTEQGSTWQVCTHLYPQACSSITQYNRGVRRLPQLIRCCYQRSEGPSLPSELKG